jgi:flagellar protein FlaF
MRQATRAYGAIANQTANPRELEADLLLSAAARLQAIRDGWNDKSPELDAALLFNRKLWSIFVTSATSSENPLPIGLRQNVANLGIFVFKQTIAILADPKPRQTPLLMQLEPLREGLRHVQRLRLWLWKRHLGRVSPAEG